MSETHVPALHLYEAIKAEIQAGTFPPGQRISAAALAKRFSTSVIPVRETLYRLVGEDLVELRHHSGFFMPRLGEATLRDLYQYQCFLLLSALDRPAAHHVEEPGHLTIAATDSSAAKIRKLFCKVAARAGNGHLDHAVLDTLDRLQTITPMKEEVIDNWAAECDRLLGQWQAGDLPAFKCALLAYHHRRLELVPALVERIDQVQASHHSP